MKNGNSLPREIAPGIFWLGDCLEQQHKGMTYHSYNAAFLLTGNESSILIETKLLSFIILFELLSNWKTKFPSESLIILFNKPSSPTFPWKLFFVNNNSVFESISPTDLKLKSPLWAFPRNIPRKPFTEPPQAMPEYCKKQDSRTAYRTYYIKEKKRFAKWTKRKIPYWFWTEDVA